MTRGTLVGHLCWAAVALAAFGIGSTRQQTSPGRGGGTSSQSSPEPARTTGATRESGRQGVSAKRGNREDRAPSGPMAALFPLPALPRNAAELEALAREAMQNGNPVTRRMAFTRLLESLTPENANLLRDHLLEFKADEGQWRDFHYAWGTIDGNAAVKRAMETKEYDMFFTMSGWASAHPERARQFLGNIPAEVKTDRELLKRGLVAGMADRDPHAASDLVYELAGQGDKAAFNLIGVVAGEVLQSMGQEEAVRWSEGLPDGALKGAAIQRVAHAYVAKDPEAAAQWAAQFAGENYAGRVIAEVAGEWAKRSPAAAVGWVESLEGVPAQQNGLSSAYTRWAERDPVAAGEHLATMPRSRQRDFAIHAFAGGLSRTDPVGAIEWANSIAHGALRNEALTRAGRVLYSRDPEAARSWLPESGLPAEAQEAIVSQRR